MFFKRITRRRFNAGLPMSLILAVFLFVSLFAGSPEKACAIGEIHLYVMPGAWSQDIPTGWIFQTHLRYCAFDKLFDNKGHAFDPGFKVDSFQWFEKFIHVQRLSEEWQLTNVIIAMLLGHTEMEGSAGGNDFHKSVTSQGDLIWTNIIGRWWEDRTIHAATGFSLKFPLGEFDKNRALNIGENRYLLYFPNLFLHFRHPVGNGLIMLDNTLDVEWRYKNPDTHYNDHDCLEVNALLTYFTSQNCDFGIFVQPDYHLALNNSTSHGESMHDDNYYTFATGLGFVWNITPGKTNINFKWEHDWLGRGLINGAFAPQVDAFHFMGTYAF